MRNKIDLAKQRRANRKFIQELRDSYKQDITFFLTSYQNDISFKLEEEKTEDGLFVFWADAEKIYKIFEKDAPYLNKLPSIGERIAVRSFYNEARSLIDGIIYNNHLLKKYQYLRCKVKRTKATHVELSEADTITQEISALGVQLRQQHNELLVSLEAMKSYF